MKLEAKLICLLLSFSLSQNEKACVCQWHAFVCLCVHLREREKCACASLLAHPLASLDAPLSPLSTHLSSVSRRTSLPSLGAPLLPLSAHLSLIVDRKTPYNTLWLVFFWERSQVRLDREQLNTRLDLTLPRYARELTSNLLFNCFSVNLTCGCSRKKTHHKVL